MNKKMREIKAQIEVLNEEANKAFEAKDLTGAENKIAEIENLEREYKIAEKLYNNDKEEVTDEVVNKVKTVDKVKAFANAVKRIANSMNETTGTEGGYTVPQDIQTDIEHLREAKFSLEQLVSVEAVNTMSGRRTYKKRSSQTGFTKVGEAGKIGTSATPQYDKIDYTIDKYAGILPVTNELFEDSDQNIYNELVTWIADESRVTRNKLIIEQVKTKSETDLVDLDGIKKALNITLGQAFKATSSVITNDDGLQYLDTLKDSDGDYLLSRNPQDPMKLVLSAGATIVPVVVIPNADLATKTNKVPFIIGDLKEGIKLFDRKKTNIMTSNTAAAGELNAFEEDLTLFRAIEREDVVVRDKDAFVNGYITVSAGA